MPEWVLDSASYRGAMKAVAAVHDPRDVLVPGRVPAVAIADLHAERRRRRAAAEAWCAERGLSFCMTVLGWRRPCPAEVAAGLTKGAGPKYAAALAAKREDWVNHDG